MINLLDLLGVVPFFFIGDCFETERGKIVCGTPCPPGKTVFDVAKKTQDKQPIIAEVAEIIKSHGEQLTNSSGHFRAIRMVAEEIDQAAIEIMGLMEKVIPKSKWGTEATREEAQRQLGRNEVIDEIRQALGLKGE
jgi:hypothetical protein